ncbi:MAG: hypothetical protein RJA76_1959, partial [Bacteroidota bacterium]
VGASGAIFAPMVANLSSDPEWWRTCYYIGGGMGLALLLMRLGTFESNLYNEMDKGVKRGDFMQLFRTKEIFLRYLYCILMGVPIWYIIGILAFSSPEITKIIGIEGTITSGDAVMYCYLGLTIGDFAAGYLSQLLKSRIKVMQYYLYVSILIMVAYLFFIKNIDVVSAKVILTLLGFFGGYWAVFVTSASEQFGTNLRSTVTTTVPNFVRGSLILVSLLFKYLINIVGLLNSAAIVGVICFSIALFALSRLKESFGQSLDFVE